jgi:hypothetical protein
MYILLADHIFGIWFVLDLYRDTLCIDPSRWFMPCSSTLRRSYGEGHAVHGIEDPHGSGLARLDMARPCRTTAPVKPDVNPTTPHLEYRKGPDNDYSAWPLVVFIGCF